VVLECRARLEPAEELAERRHRTRERSVLDAGAAAVGEEGADRLRVELAHVAEAWLMTEPMSEPIAELAPVALIGIDSARAGVAFMREMIAPTGECGIEIA
jgi:hypothetical protein